MVKPLHTALLLLLLLGGCTKEKETFTVVDAVPVYPRGDINRFYQAMDRNPDTVFVISAEAPATLRTTNGVLLEVPANAFSFQGGESVNGVIRLQWKEIRTLYDQIARRMSHGHRDALLLSAFSFELLADKEGVPLELLLPITVKWPDNQPKGMLDLWYGRHVAGEDFQWTESLPGSVSISSWVDPVLGSGTNGYFFTIERGGMISVAALQDMSQEQTSSVDCVFFPAYHSGNTAVWFIEPAFQRAIALQDAGEGRFVLPAIAKGTSGKLFSVTEAVRHRYFSATLDVALTADTLRWDPRPAEQPLILLHQWIRSL